MLIKKKEKIKEEEKRRYIPAYGGEEKRRS
jgi:hypothetical protein